MTLMQEIAAYPVEGRQLVLEKSPKHDAFFNHMVEVWKLKPLDVEALIILRFPHLLDPNYLGYTDEGKLIEQLSEVA
jgi:hypothetical protein